MNAWGLLLGAIAAVGAVGGIGCGGSDPVAPGPVLVVLKYQGPCEAGRQIACACVSGAMGAQVCKDDGSAWGICEGCDGAGGSGATSSTTGAGGEGGSTTSSTSSGSSSASSTASASSSSGTGGGPCVPTVEVCDPNATCGDFDNGCGTMLHCGGCDGATPTDKVTCDPVAHVCGCTPVVGSQAAKDYCTLNVPGGVPMFCGPFPTSPKVACSGEGPIVNGDPTTCCVP